MIEEEILNQIQDNYKKGGTMELLVALRTNNLDIESKSIDSLRKYIKFLEKWNKVHALTSVSSKEIPYVFVVEPLLAAKALSKFVNPAKCLDIGTGFGNPGVAMSAYFKNTRFMLVDSSQKKTALLRSAIDMSEIGNIKVVTKRIEELAKTHKGTFDLVVSRGVGSIEKVTKYAKDFAKPGGIVAIFKARIDQKKEVSGITNDLKFERIVNLDVFYPLKKVHRYIIMYKKMSLN